MQKKLKTHTPEKSIIYVKSNLHKARFSILTYVLNFFNFPYFLEFRPIVNITHKRTTNKQPHTYTSHIKDTSKI